MSSMTISKTRDNLSSIVSDIERGTLTEHFIQNRSRVVARIVPVESTAPVEQRIGAAKDKPFLLDDEAFDALDDEVAEMFGV